MRLLSIVNSNRLSLIYFGKNTPPEEIIVFIISNINQLSFISIVFKILISFFDSPYSPQILLDKL